MSGKKSSIKKSGEHREKRGEKIEKSKNKGSKKVLKKLLEYISKYKLLLVISIVLAAVTVVLQLYIPMLFGDAIDNITAEGTVNFLKMWEYLRKILAFAAVSGVFGWIMSVINNNITYRVVQDIRSKAIRHIQKLPLKYLDQHSTGDIVSRIIADADILSDGLLLGFTQLFSGIVTIIVTIAFMFSKNLWITLMVILLTPVSFSVAKFIASKSYKTFRKQSEIRGTQTALIDEMVENQKVVQAYGYEEKAYDRFSSLNDNLFKYSLKAVFYSSLTNPSTRFINNIVYAGVALLGIFLIPLGSLTVGGLSVLLSYANQYMRPFNDISSVITEMQNALACAARLFSLLDEPEEQTDSAKELKDVKGYVDIEKMSFSYKKDQSFIENFNLSTTPGMRVAIVGPTGCGKTTLINLLMRFYDIDGGSIKIDGQDIKTVSRRSLRSAFGMVLQDTWIKHGTVRENIAFGKPSATDEEILRAAKEAHSLEFIERLPNGLDTVLSEDRISQGEKQLLCITRVMLTHPPMLILDEATSSIDTRTELLIQQAFDKLMRGRTSFIVAHRLSTVRNASVILVMRGGKIIERGTHRELIEKNGFYSKLYNSQFL